MYRNRITMVGLVTQTKFLTKHVSGITEPTMELAVTGITSLWTHTRQWKPEGPPQVSFLRTSSTLRQSVTVLELNDSSTPRNPPAHQPRKKFTIKNNFIHTKINKYSFLFHYLPCLTAFVTSGILIGGCPKFLLFRVFVCLFFCLFACFISMLTL